MPCFLCCQFLLRRKRGRARLCAVWGVERSNYVRGRKNTREARLGRCARARTAEPRLPLFLQSSVRVPPATPQHCTEIQCSNRSSTSWDRIVSTDYETRTSLAATNAAPSFPRVYSDCRRMPVPVRMSRERRRGADADSGLQEPRAVRGSSRRPTDHLSPVSHSQFLLFALSLQCSSCSDVSHNNIQFVRAVDFPNLPVLTYLYEPPSIVVSFGSLTLSN